MKKAEYKIVRSSTGFEELEEKVTTKLNDGWKTIGGIAFNTGYCYQAMARIITIKLTQKS